MSHQDVSGSHKKLNLAPDQNLVLELNKKNRFECRIELSLQCSHLFYIAICVSFIKPTAVQSYLYFHDKTHRCFEITCFHKMCFTDENTAVQSSSLHTICVSVMKPTTVLGSPVFHATCVSMMIATAVQSSNLFPYNFCVTYKTDGCLEFTCASILIVFQSVLNWPVFRCQLTILRTSPQYMSCSLFSKSIWA